MPTPPRPKPAPEGTDYWAAAKFFIAVCAAIGVGLILKSVLQW